MEYMRLPELSDVSALAGVVGGIVASYFGGWDTALTTLLIFMAIDFVSGLALSGVFHRSTKTDGGALSSEIGSKGLSKKGMVLLIVLVATQLDAITGTNFLRDATITAYIVVEVISIIENAGLMGVPIPKRLKSAIEVLKEKEL